MSMDYTKKRRCLLGLILVGLVLYYVWFVLFTPANKPQVQTMPTQSTSKALVEKGYEVLPVSITAHPSVQALIGQDPGLVQLINFFSYGCYGCMRWHPFIEKWAKQHTKEVVFYQSPILLNKAWEPFARIYFIVKELKKNETLDDILFKMIQARELDLSDKKTLGAFFEKQGIPLKTFEDLYDSFTVNQDLLRAKDLAMAYQITLSPSLVLNTPRGSYLITPPMIPQGRPEGLITVLDKLLESSGGL